VPSELPWQISVPAFSSVIDSGQGKPIFCLSGIPLGCSLMRSQKMLCCLMDILCNGNGCRSSVGCARA